MWFRKKTKKQIVLAKYSRGDKVDMDELRAAVGMKPASEDQVKCYKCKCLLYQNDAKVVEVGSRDYFTSSDSIFKKYYCLRDAPKYGKIVMSHMHNNISYQKWVKPIEGHWVSCTEEGVVSNR